MKVEHREYEPLNDDELRKMNLKNIRELKHLIEKLKIPEQNKVLNKIKKEQ